MRPTVLASLAFCAAILVGGVARSDEPAPVATPAPAAAPVVPPTAVTTPSATYPAGASGEATVLVVLTIDASGHVTDAVPTEVNEPFSSAAAETARTWTFEPATRDGRPIAARIRVEVTFRPPVLAPDPAAVAAEQAAARAAEESRAADLKRAGAGARVDEEQVTVRGERVEPSRTVSLSRTEVRQIPGTFGDPFRAIEMMPGVTPVVSGLPFFFIRGAPPGNVGYFLDGVRVPLLFHVGVGPSAVHPALIERVDLYPGGYPARFGRFSGGIVSGEMTKPATEAHGEANLRLFDAGAMVETPFAGGKGTALVGGRYSYTAALLSLLASDTTLAYWDYQARATYEVTPDDRLGVLAFGSYDYLGQRTPTGTITIFGTEFHRVDLRHDHRIDSKGDIRTAVTLGIDRSRLTDDRVTRDRMVAARSELTYQVTPRMLVRAGTDLQADSYDVELGSSTLAPSTAAIAFYFPTRTDLAMGARVDAVLSISKIFEVTPGARVDFFTSQGATAIGVDPRLALRTHLSPTWRMLTALGVAHQAPSFVVPVPGFQPGGLRGGLQKAVQESTGFEWDLGKATIATATVFHNAFYDMSDPLGSAEQTIAGCAPGTFPVDTIAGDRGGQPGNNSQACGVPRFPPGTIGPDRSGGGGQGADSNNSRRVQSAFEVRTRGQAFGLELFLKRKLTSRIGGFFSYTLSRSTRNANGRDYIATFDRTHVANAALAFDLGRSWRAGTRVMFYTGLPKASGDTTDPSSTRLNPFFRLDLRLEKRWSLGRTRWISFVAEWMNATLSKEEVATTCTLQGCQAQKIGPVTIPSLGLEGGF
ncbi:MAG: TonB family protein / TonB-dependent receptor [Labilithrix sp.]|nr:TonB family protein / TonB-dependent receptor [Labilithrix sp.]